MSKVKVRKADENGNVISISKNPEYGFITVEQDAIEFNHGWLRTVNRSALVHGRVEDLKMCKYTAGSEIPGKIVIIESLVPFDNENPDRDLKLAGSTGVICRVDDQPIYRRSFFTTNMNDTDQFIAHSNADEIREVQAAQRAISKMKADVVEL